MNLCNREETSRLLGNPAQMFGVKRMIVDEGKSKGDTVYEVTTGGGLAYTVTPDTGMDIGDLTYRGVNIRYITKNGLVSGKTFQHFENDFCSTWPGGMLYTCGLTSTGNGCREESGVYHPAHGRYHSVPAEQCGAAADIDTGKLTVSGVVRETKFSGHMLEMKRTVTSPIGEARLEITDVLTNGAPEAADYMLLYHMNFGYPFLSKDLVIELPDGTRTAGNNPHTVADTYADLTDPVDGLDEELYMHRVPAKDGFAHIRLLNPTLGIGVEVGWSADTLPIMMQWKCMRSGEYVLGIEPTVTPSRGRVEEQRAGDIGKLAPFESKSMKVYLQFFDI